MPARPAPFHFCWVLIGYFLTGYSSLIGCWAELTREPTTVRWRIASFVSKENFSSRKEVIIIIKKQRSGWSGKRLTPLSEVRNMTKMLRAAALMRNLASAGWRPAARAFSVKVMHAFISFYSITVALYLNQSVFYTGLINICFVLAMFALTMHCRRWIKRMPFCTIEICVQS